MSSRKLRLWNGHILQKLEERTKKFNDINERKRLQKYVRDNMNGNNSSICNPTTAANSTAQARHQPINLTEVPINPALAELCKRGPSFVPTPVSVDWNDLQQNWLQFTKKVRWRAFFHSHDKPVTRDENILNPPRRKSRKDPPLAGVPAIEGFLDRVEKDLFKETAFKNVPDNVTPEKRKALKEFRSTPVEKRNSVIRIQDKGNNFVFLNSELDQSKLKEQMDRSSFEVLSEDPSQKTIVEIDKWVDKWKPWGLSDKWIEFITENTNAHPGVNYRLIKTHKVNNPARVITSGCGTPTANLSLFVEKYCKVVVDSISCRVRDTSHMLGIIDSLNEKGILDGDMLVSFDIINMFPSIDNDTGVERVRCKLTEFSDSLDMPVECIIEKLFYLPWTILASKEWYSYGT